MESDVGGGVGDSMGGRFPSPTGPTSPYLEGAGPAEAKTEKGIIPTQTVRRLWHAHVLLCFSFQGKGVNIFPLLPKVFPLG